MDSISQSQFLHPFALKFSNLHRSEDDFAAKGLSLGFVLDEKVAVLGKRLCLILEAKLSTPIPAAGVDTPIKKHRIAILTLVLKQA